MSRSMSVESTEKLVERAPVGWGFITNPGVKFAGVCIRGPRDQAPGVASLVLSVSIVSRVLLSVYRYLCVATALTITQNCFRAL